MILSAVSNRVSVQAIVEAMRMNTSVTKLDLNMNDIGEGAKAWPVAK